MGTTMRRADVPQNIDEAKRMASGFWSHDYRMDTCESVWRCDRLKLNEEVRRIMLDPRESQEFACDPRRYLDVRFGDGTSEVYSKSWPDGQHYVQFRFPDWMRKDKAVAYDRYFGWDLAREKDMALTSHWNTSNTNTATVTDSTWNSRVVRNELISDELKRTTKRVTDKIKFKKRTVKTLPFRKPQHNTLLETLQMEFDHWAGAQVSDLFN